MLRLGFGGVLALLGISAIEAFRIQQGAASQTAQISQRFAQQVEIQTTIRRTLYLGSIQSRDYMLSNRPDRLATLLRQLGELKGAAAAALDQLQLVTGAGGSQSELRETVRDFWATIEATPLRTGGMQGSQLYDYVQVEIVPRRNAAGAFLRELEEVNHAALRQSQEALDRSRRHALWRLLGMMGLCLVLGAVVARLSLRHAARLERESARRFEEVAQAKQDLEQLSARLLEIQEDERRRISRELHDEIGQTLTALRIEISRAQAAWKAGSPAVPDRLEEARSLAERTVQTVRDISLLLRPALLDDLGLAAALQYQAEDFGRRSGIPCLFTEEGLGDSLPDTHKTCVYRVVQEALNNCEKHSGATRVRLAVRQKGGELAVEVEDNGRGLRAAPQGRSSGEAGLGIVGMRERASMLDGVLEYEAVSGGGTRLRLLLPLPQPAAVERSV
ncbi:MAG: sensor histidine kinase [Acidobacteria bacterium]|nr:sensor histidine kinase [Acidobacteriota bacterium]